MAKERKHLDIFLCQYLETANVYYQPPESVLIKYPAVIYKLDDIQNITANNSMYMQKKAYMVTVIDKEIESELVTKMSKLLNCQFVNNFVSDNLYHTVFRLYY